MIIDSHEHVMLPTTMQIQKLDEAEVDKAILFTTTPHIEKAKSSTLECKFYTKFWEGVSHHRNE